MSGSKIPDKQRVKKFIGSAMFIIFVLMGVLSFGDEQTDAPAATGKPAVSGVQTETEGTSDAENFSSEKPDIKEDGAMVRNGKRLSFRNQRLLSQHYEKHGLEMGFASAGEYEAAARKVAENESALHKTEKEDGDDVYYLEATNEFVIVSKDGYIRTYFNPSGGIGYYNRQ